MGVFAEWQPKYAGHGIPTFPLNISDGQKKPATKGYARTGLKGSGQLVLKFPDVNAFAFMAGERSGVTVVDIDSPDDEDMLRDVLRRYGDTPLISRTGSGGFHLYYRHGGEDRKIRIDPNMPVDRLGGGVVAAPPSMGSKGAYRFIRGTLADLERLPFVRADNIDGAVQDAVRHELVKAGGRNKALMEYLRPQWRYVDDEAAFLDVAFTYANTHLDRTGEHPFTDDEVRNVARSVWAWAEDKVSKGQYFVGTGRYLQLSHDAIDRVLPLGADALMLFMVLKRRSDHRQNLIVANDMRLTMPDGEWTLVRFRRARQILIDNGVLKETRPASTWHGPATYAWQG